MGRAAKLQSLFETAMTDFTEQLQCIEYANAIIDSGRKLVEKDFYDDYPCFVDCANYQNYNYPYHHIFNPVTFDKWKNNHKSIFHGFDDFSRHVMSLRSN